MIDNLTIVAVANSFLFAFLLYQLKGNKPDDELDNILQLFLKLFYVAMIALSLYTAAHVSLINGEHCSWQVVNETVTESTTTFGQEYLCTNNDYAIYTGYFKITNYLLWVLGLYAMISVIVLIYRATKVIIDRISNR